jgi:hypothetical protein
MEANTAFCFNFNRTVNKVKIMLASFEKISRMRIQFQGVQSKRTAKRMVLKLLFLDFKSSEKKV